MSDEQERAQRDGTAFTAAERDHLVAHPLGRLVTISPSGAPHVKPVAFWGDGDTETIDLGGPALSGTQRFRDVQADPRVSLVVDDQADHPVGPGGQTGRGLEIRGVAEILRLDRPLMPMFSDEAIRIHPRRVIAWNIDGPGLGARDVRCRDRHVWFKRATPALRPCQGTAGSQRRTSTPDAVTLPFLS